MKSWITISNTKVKSQIILVNVDVLLLVINLPDDAVLVLEPVVAVQQLDGAAELVVEWHIVGAQQRPVVGLAVEAYCNMPMSWDPCFTL